MGTTSVCFAGDFVGVGAGEEFVGDTMTSTIPFDLSINLEFFASLECDSGFAIVAFSCDRSVEGSFNLASRVALFDSASFNASFVVSHFLPISEISWCAESNASFSDWVSD